MNLMTISAFVLALLSALAQAVRAWTGSGMDKANAAKTINEAADLAVNRANKQIELLTEQFTQRITDLEEEVARLNREMGIEIAIRRRKERYIAVLLQFIAKSGMQAPAEHSDPPLTFRQDDDDGTVHRERKV